MRFFLILVLIHTYVGGIIALIAFSVHSNSVPMNLIAIFLFVVFVNIFRARYLYLKASTYKLEWTLLGLLGNVNAILFHWLWQRISSHWKRGKGLFDPE